MSQASVLRLVVVLALLSGTAFSQPSFDCAMAGSTVEKTICADASLAALDVALAQTYRRTLSVAGPEQFLIQAEQRQWLAALADDCDKSNASDCIRPAMEKRIKELESEAASPSKGTTVFRETHVSRGFDFTFRMRAHAPDDREEYREGPAEIFVMKKRSDAPFQTIRFQNVFASLGGDGKPLTNSAQLYDDQGLINVGDFNFDGEEDFAVQTGNEGSYGQPSYSVYLYSASDGKFHLSPAFSKLTVIGLGFFDIDAKRKRLIVFSKDGCCYHESTEYRIQNNLPVPDSREIDDGNRVLHQKYVNGNWRGTTK